MLHKLPVALGILKGEVYLRIRRIPHGSRPYLRGWLPRIVNRGEIRVGRRFRVDSLQYRVEISTGPAGRLIIGDEVLINRGATIHASQLITIGSNVQIGDLCAIYDTSFHQVEHGAEVSSAPVHIGDNVWLGRGVIVLPGVTIGDHSVVGAGTVVATEIPPRSLVTGASAVVRRELRAPDGWARDN